MDVHVKSQQLLESLANSILDRSPDNPVFFSAHESHVVEKFLEDYAREVLRNAGAY